MFMPSGVAAAAGAGGPSVVYAVTAGFMGDPPTGASKGGSWSDAGVIAPNNTFKGTTLSFVITGLSGFFQIALDGINSPNVDTNWKSARINGIFTGGQAEYTMLRSNTTYDNDNQFGDSTWKQNGVLGTDGFVQGQTYTLEIEYNE